MEFSRNINCLGTYDVLVAGAGPAGLCAAVSAARMGKSVLLIERYGIVGGCLTSGFVGPMMGGISSGTMSTELNELLNDGTGMHHDVEQAKIKLMSWLEQENVKVLLGCPVVDVITEKCKICGVIVGTQSGLKSISAKIVIDATGDGVVSYLAGAPTEMGRDDGKVQPATIMFTIENIDEKQTIVCYHEEDDTLLPNGNYLQLCRDANKTGELPKEINIVRLYRTAYSKTSRMVNATQINGINGLEPESIAYAETELRKQMSTVVNFLRKNVWGFENCRIQHSSTMVGIRETRRVIGEYVLTAEDLIAGRKFESAVVHNAYFDIDIHNPDGAGQAESDTLPVSVKSYDIPYEALIPLKIDNLITCGRCISGTHRAHASYRVMNIASATGQAAGVAAALCIETDNTPRNMDVKKVQTALINHGVHLFD